MLLCDVGNTYFHFFYKGRVWKEMPNLLSKKSEEYRIYYISVNERYEKKLLESHHNCLNIYRHILLNTNYKGLGVDRKAACFGVKNGVIVDAGSAITIDIMQEGIHKGGYILPGIGGYRKFYADFDVLNIEFNLAVSLDDMPQNTRDAISYGFLKSVILSIKDTAKSSFIYFTGGDGKFLSNFFSNSVYDDTLVFKGMMKAINNALLFKGRI